MVLTSRSRHLGSGRHGSLCFLILFGFSIKWSVPKKFNTWTCNQFSNVNVTFESITIQYQIYGFLKVKSIFRVETLFLQHYLVAAPSKQRTSWEAELCQTKPSELVSRMSHHLSFEGELKACNRIVAGECHVVLVLVRQHSNLYCIVQHRPERRA